MPVLAIDDRAKVCCIQAGKAWQAEAGERMLWVGCTPRSTSAGVEDRARISPAQQTRPAT